MRVAQTGTQLGMGVLIITSSWKTAMFTFLLVTDLKGKEKGITFLILTNEDGEFSLLMSKR